MTCTTVLSRLIAHTTSIMTPCTASDATDSQQSILLTQSASGKTPMFILYLDAGLMLCRFLCVVSLLLLWIDRDLDECLFWDHIRALVSYDFVSVRFPIPV